MNKMAGTKNAALEDHVFYSNVDPAEAQRSFRLRGLDGLRAIAVCSVLVYHLWPTVLPGGMMGVDIFFVISGFLITALLLKEGALTGKMNIVQFWVRRLRRLIPAIIVLVAVVGGLALIIGGDIQVGLGRQVLGAFTFSSNWLYIASGNDYFAQTSPELLTNFWSLAVEEQFYIFWPIALVFIFMWVASWRKRLAIPLVLALLSVVLSAVLTAVGASASRIYYGTDTHLFGIMLGVSLALLIPWSMYPPADSRLYPVVGYGEGIWGILRGLVGWVCLIAIFPLARRWGDHDAFFMPWDLLLASVLAVGVIQALLADSRGPVASLLRNVLSLPPLVWIGQRSYGIYLWHWPLAVIAHYVFGPENRFWTSWVVLFASFIVAGLSYMFVEDPIRRLGFGRALRAFGRALVGPAKALPIVSLALFLLGAVGTGFAIANAPAMTEAEAVVASGEDHAQTTVAPQPQPSASASAKDGVVPGSVRIIGDSVTVASADALQSKLPQASIDGEVSRTLVADLPQIKEDAANHQLGQVVVVSLATNSTLAQSQIDELVQALAPHQERKIVLVTGAAPSNLTWVAGSNDLMHQAAQKYPDTVLVADWAQAAAGHSDYLVSDGVHPQGQGQQVYAQTIADAVAKAQKQLKDEGKLSEEDLKQASESPSADPTPAPSAATAKAW